MTRREFFKLCEASGAFVACGLATIPEPIEVREICGRDWCMMPDEERKRWRLLAHPRGYNVDVATYVRVRT